MVLSKMKLFLVTIMGVMDTTMMTMTMIDNHVFEIDTVFAKTDLKLI
ncbi:MAG: hypothetical protein H6936_02720 [Burkholderiales bacterium]|nr:hypothetical protein [Nitrosomonas sp.]MCP5273768.1 hypothetical protein [Burkholderiales bacterium]